MRADDRDPQVVLPVLPCRLRHRGRRRGRPRGRRARRPRPRRLAGLPLREGPRARSSSTRIPPRLRGAQQARRRTASFVDIASEHGDGRGRGAARGASSRATARARSPCTRARTGSSAPASRSSSPGRTRSARTGTSRRTRSTSPRSRPAVARHGGWDAGVQRFADADVLLFVGNNPGRLRVLARGRPALRERLHAICATRAGAA